MDTTLLYEWQREIEFLDGSPAGIGIALNAAAELLVASKPLRLDRQGRSVKMLASSETATHAAKRKGSGLKSMRPDLFHHPFIEQGDVKIQTSKWGDDFAEVHAPITAVSGRYRIGPESMISERCCR